MNLIDSKLLGPDVIKRVRGGYLAVSKRSVGIRIGAIGDTEDQARTSFNKLVDQWFRAKEAETLAASSN